MQDPHFKNIVKLFAILIVANLLVGSAYYVGYIDGQQTNTVTQDHIEHRQIELELAEVKERLATLERIGVEIYMFGDTPYRVKGK